VSENSIPEGFKMTELGSLPEEWDVVRLGDVVKKTEQKDPKKSPGWRFKYIDVSSITRENLQIVDYKSYQGNEAPSRAKKLVKNRDVIFATIRPTLKRLTLIDEDFDGEICSTAFCVLRTREDILSQLFLLYAVQRDIFIEKLGKIQRGASYPAVTDSDVKDQKIPLPPLPEQRAIAKVLSTVQGAREKTEAVVTATKELKKSMMKHMFTYGPVPREEAENVPLKETEIGMVPEEWEVVRLGEKFIVKTSFPAFNSIQNIDTKNNDDELVLALKVSDMNNPINQKYINESLITFRHPISEVTKRRFLQPGSIIFPKRGAAISTNKKRITKYYSILDPNLIGIEPRKDIHKEFLFGFFEQFDLRSLQDNTPIPQLNKNQVNSILFPLPPLPDQQKIATILSAVDRKIETEETKKKSLDELFKSLLHNLMTGKLRVTEL
jgi:type I restriction enzyme S subunit